MMFVPRITLGTHQNTAEHPRAPLIHTIDAPMVLQDHPSEYRDLQNTLQHHWTHLTLKGSLNYRVVSEGYFLTNIF
jgi:hypothetical protein